MPDEYSSGAAPTASKLVQRLTITLAVLLVCGSIFWAGDVYRKGFGWLLFPQQIVSGLIGISLLSGLVGLLVILPILGHASWHLYRRAIPAAQQNI